MKHNIEDINLVMTCGACPEQYDAFIDNERVGYLRLRHGYFYVDFPECGGETIYDAHPKGDGIFETEEREFYLLEAKKAIIKKLYIKDLPVKAMSDFNDIGRMFKYQCQTCGNECLQEARPDNTVCQPECTNPDWKLMKYQQHYKVGEQDFVLSEGEV